MVLGVGYAKEAFRHPQRFVMASTMIAMEKSLLMRLTLTEMASANARAIVTIQPAW